MRSIFKFCFQITVFLLLTCSIKGQTDTLESVSESKFEFKGYIKYLHSASFSGLNNIVGDNLFHNRLNFKAYLSDNFTFDLQVRNRLFWGQYLNPDLKNLIDDAKEIDLSFFPIDKPGLLLHSKIDRLSFEYNYKNWEFKIGRQRLNWGKTWAWNSNDLFNAYNFLDYDYEERPGNDAISILYYTGSNSYIQGAYSYSKDFNNSIIALRYQFQISSYDIQILTASYLKDYAFGVGWEGNLKNAGFKGETTAFVPKTSDSISNTAVLSSISLDYFFNNGIMLLGSVLYNSNSIKDVADLSLLFSQGESVNARYLMPNKWSFLLQSSYEINPASSCSIGVLYLKDFNALALLPAYTYAIANDWDLNFFGQLFFMKTDEKFKNLQNVLVMRLRYSF